eukprot:COSAG04_NODE_1178_length_7908_cov_5.961484_4_plen_195_part_00
MEVGVTPSAGAAPVCCCIGSSSRVVASECTEQPAIEAIEAEPDLSRARRCQARLFLKPRRAGRIVHFDGGVATSATGSAAMLPAVRPHGGAGGGREVFKADIEKQQLRLIGTDTKSRRRASRSYDDRNRDLLVPSGEFPCRYQQVLGRRERSRRPPELHRAPPHRAPPRQPTPGQQAHPSALPHPHPTVPGWPA